MIRRLQLVLLVSMTLVGPAKSDSLLGDMPIFIEPVQNVTSVATAITNTTTQEVRFWLKVEGGKWTMEKLAAGQAEEYRGGGADYNLQIIGQKDKTIWRLSPMERWAFAWNNNGSAIIVKKIVQDE